MPSITPDDIFRHRLLGPLHATNASDRALLTVKRARRDKDDYRTTLWLWSPRAHRRVVASKHSPSSAKLSRDGTHFAFLASNARGERVVRVQGVDDADSRAIGDASSAWQSIEDWSPDGTRLLLIRKIAWQEDEFDDPEAGKDRPRVVTHLPYKQDGGGSKAGWRSLLVELDLVTGTQRTLVQGDFNVESGAWSPDGSRLCFVRARGGTQRHRSDAWLANADGTQARQASYGVAAINRASWSPDGTKIAIAAGEIEGDSLATLYLLDVASGEFTRATRETLHLETPAPVWHPDGRRMAVVASLRGLHPIVVVDANDGSLRPLRHGLRHTLALAATREGLLQVSASMRQPCELFAVDWDGGAPRRLSNFNRGWSAARTRPRVAKRAFTVPDGRGGEESIEAWVLTPPHAAKPWPVFVDMHGGPHSDTLIDFANHLYWYLLVSNGWMVVSPNAVGSSGYGDEFARRLRAHWGEFDLPQFLTVLGALRERGEAGEVAACGGKSYGGFLSAYAAGHCDAFERIVVSAPVADIESHFGTSDSGYYVTPYAMKGEVEAHRERYHRLSPLQDISRTAAPILLLQGDHDERCPLDQSEELFAALVRAGREAKMIVYPRGSHSMAANGRPSHRVDYHRRFAAWVCAAIDGRERGAGARSPDASGTSRDVPTDNISEAGAMVRQVGSRGSSSRE